MFLALYLTHTPLQRYLKNYALSDAENLTSGNEKPLEYIEKIYNERTRLVNDKFYRWRDFNKVANDFYVLIISYRVTRENMKFYAALDDEDVRNSKSIMDEIRDVFPMSAGIAYKNTKKLKITVALRKFLYEKSEFEMGKIYLFDPLSNKEYIKKIKDKKG